jgi:hypothetical protein
MSSVEYSEALNAAYEQFVEAEEIKSGLHPYVPTPLQYENEKRYHELLMSLMLSLSMLWHDTPEKVKLVAEKGAMFNAYYNEYFALRSQTEEQFDEIIREYSVVADCFLEMLRMRDVGTDRELERADDLFDKTKIGFYDKLNRKWAYGNYIIKVTSPLFAYKYEFRRRRLGR